MLFYNTYVDSTILFINWFSSIPWVECHSLINIAQFYSPTYLLQVIGNGSELGSETWIFRFGGFRDWGLRFDDLEFWQRGLR